MLEVEALAGLDADSLHLREDRLVGDVRRVQLEEFGCVGEELSADMVSTWVFGGVFMSTLGSILTSDRLRRLAPLRRAGDLVARLDLVDRSVIGGPVRLGAADNPDIRGRCVDPLYPRQLNAPCPGSSSSRA